ncbi:TPA: hypothetical protein N0F65_005928 [Lagenidium giganteum]|uniref:Uncharacterized protein n=1 Tax=Lagenidium giganteum TaxID=4803 RepID=A0AAV2Z9A9_9STRA|nr:TPA: hypothetical protein N0F65_005928 [Lagenidium giganteum]
MERLYKFIENNIAYILLGGNGYYLTKNRDAFGDIDYIVIPRINQFDMWLDINNAIELDENGLIETDNTEFGTDSIITVSLSEVILHYRDDITFGKVDFMPYNAKTGSCDTQLNTFDWNHPQNDAPMTKEKSDMQKSAIEKPVQWLIECVTNWDQQQHFQESHHKERLIR